MVAMFLSVGMIPTFAHTSTNIENYEIEVGWVTEPPVVGIRNDIAIKIIERGEKEGTFTGITSAFKNLDATIMFGGLDKQIDINSDPRPGYYFSPIIPTKSGTYMLELQGEIRGTDIDVKIPIEDVESTAVLDFPATSLYDNNVGALEHSLKNLKEDIALIKSNSKGKYTDDSESPLIFSILAISLSVSAIFIGILSMIKRT
ncbi:hypothetical protein AAA799E16_00735 [Marine Group I thaumarchaeote SCGC AAA799-E16]|uniref:Uncharacterized protein n=3 Tax=Marine Group I TaxID=905826 RepID=A0A087S9A6_9ARCH|nr:hypothetical protein AAA799E16_00735 [Marine Group I thaumarchaeote SCGC AAA799-E16]KFM18429.1 hypothetical protein SCCGRSA3_01115 [Marine Group I thaumarchaeote SCGC RSA3]KFM22310.1 hypothetical protein AAA799B03_00060 [Marine Group I thaumarchaeote SCGC AAA799-B03]